MEERYAVYLGACILLSNQPGNRVTSSVSKKAAIKAIQQAKSIWNVALEEFRERGTRGGEGCLRIGDGD